MSCTSSQSTKGVPAKKFSPSQTPKQQERQTDSKSIFLAAAMKARRRSLINKTKTSESESSASDSDWKGGSLKRKNKNLKLNYWTPW